MIEETLEAILHELQVIKLYLVDLLELQRKRQMTIDDAVKWVKKELRRKINVSQGEGE